MIPIAVSGACGRMAGQVLRRAAEDDSIRVVAAVDTSRVGEDIGEVLGMGAIGVTVAPPKELEQELQSKNPLLLVDFTNPEASVENARTAAANKVGVVVGTTGFSKTQLEEIGEAVRKNGVAGLIAPNFSACVNLFFKLAAEAAKVLQGYDLEIVEVHHVHKKDAPSGTAKKLAERVAASMGKSPSDIRIESVREGEVVGDHAITFDSAGERMEIKHHAKSRDAFAYGCLRAIKWLAGQKPGLYGMKDVLGL